MYFVLSNESIPSWTPGLPEGSLVIALVSRSVRGPSIFKYLRDRYWFFPTFCMKLVDHKGTKVTEPDFFKKIRWCPHF